MEVRGRQTFRGEPLLVSIRVVPSSSFQSRVMSVDPSGIHPGFLVEIMPSVEVPKTSSVVGPIGAEVLTAGVLPTPVSSSSSSEKLDYS